MTLKGKQEVVGYLAALTSIKGEIYLSGNGRSGDMDSPVKSLVNQMVDYYLNQKGAYEAYYHTTGIYEKTKDAQRAASEGLAYAYRLFLEKKGDAAYRNQRAYSEEAGFFQMLGGRDFGGGFSERDAAFGRELEGISCCLGAGGERDYASGAEVQSLGGCDGGGGAEEGQGSEGGEGVCAADACSSCACGGIFTLEDGCGVILLEFIFGDLERGLIFWGMGPILCI